MDEGLRLILWLTIIVVIAVTALLGLFNGSSMAAEEFADELREKDIIVTKGYIESPSVLIMLNRTDFMSMAKSGITIYQSHTEFYIFNDAMTIAYRYAIPPTWRLW